MTKAAGKGRSGITGHRMSPPGPVYMRCNAPVQEEGSPDGFSSPPQLKLDGVLVSPVFIESAWRENVPAVIRWLRETVSEKIAQLCAQLQMLEKKGGKHFKAEGRMQKLQDKIREWEYWLKEFNRLIALGKPVPHLFRQLPEA